MEKKNKHLKRCNSSQLLHIISISEVFMGLQPIGLACLQFNVHQVDELPCPKARLN